MVITRTRTFQFAVILVQVLGHQQVKLHREDIVVDLKDLFFLDVRQLPTDEAFPDDFLQLFLRLQILSDMLLDRTRHITQIRLARVVQQAAEDHLHRTPALNRLLSAGDAVLGNRVKVFEMSVRAANQRQRVRDVLNVDILRIWIQRIKMFAGHGGDIAHIIAPKWF